MEYAIQMTDTQKIKLEEKIEKERKSLKKTHRFELLNRLVCYACVLPFFYCASCIGQKKNISTPTKMAAGIFLFSLANGIRLNNKKEKTTANLNTLSQKYQESRES